VEADLSWEQVLDFAVWVQPEEDPVIWPSYNWLVVFPRRCVVGCLGHTISWPGLCGEVKCHLLSSVFIADRLLWVRLCYLCVAR